MASMSNPVGTQSTGSTSSSSSNDQLTGDSFIQLLTAQLQAQDPLDPIDPTTFVTQLVQFNQLEQLIDINQTLSAGAATTGTAATQTAAAQIAPAQPGSRLAAAGIL